MSAPDFSEWFHLRGEEADTFFPRVIRPVVDRWEREAGFGVFLRITRVNLDWCRLDGWIAPEGVGPEDQGPPPTEADIPIGFV